MRIALTSLILLGTTATGALAAPTYTVTPIAPAGYSSSSITSLNNSGAAVGSYGDADFNTHAFYASSSGAITTLPDLGFGAAAQSVNDSNQIVGSVTDSAGHLRAAYWASPTSTPVVIGPVANTGNFSNAYSISNNGTIVGNVQYSSGHTYQHGFVYTATAGFVDYGSLNTADTGEYSTFAAVNDNGQILGTTYRPGGTMTAERATVGTPNVFTSAATGLTNLVPVGINTVGTGVGHSGSVTTGLPYRFNTDNTATQLDVSGLLDTLNGASANAINDSADIVGGFNGVKNGASYFSNFILSGGTAYDLYAATLNASDWSRFNGATDINNAGLIAGSGIYNGVLTGYLLTATPEPGSLAMIGAAGAMFLRRRRM